MATTLDDETTISRDAKGNTKPRQIGDSGAVSAPRPLSLSDAQLDATMNAAAPLLPRDRSLFLEDVAAALRGFDEIGDGVVARVAREVQRKYLRPPDLSRSRDCSRYRR